MLTFRKINYVQDLDHIMELIQKNLDPDFTRESFEWKHLENPFGISYGLLALDSDKIVGLRMFMFWKFLGPAKRLINAIRPVDTVIDMAYRGQGLFTKLTLKGLDDCKEDYELIFNTPNENSLPGYLKMDWQKLEQVNHFKIAPVNPFSKPLKFENIDADLIDYQNNYPRFEKISTFMSSEYLNWRYKSATYFIAFFAAEELYVAYCTSAKYIIVLEVIGNSTNLHKALNSLAVKLRKPFVYYYDSKYVNKPRFPFTIKRKKPDIIIKNHQNLNSASFINFTLADLEAVF